MKKVILISVFMFSFMGTAQAVTAEDICKSFSFSSDRIACLTYINNKFMDDVVMEICDDLSFSSSKMGCLKATANKMYSLAQKEICGDASFDSGKVECLQATGTWVIQNPRRGQLLAILKLAKRAINQMDQGDWDGAYTSIEFLIEQVRPQFLNF